MSIGWRMVLGAAVGAIIGLAVYRFVGCRTGACPLNSNPWTSMILWSVVGLMFSRGL